MQELVLINADEVIIHGGEGQYYTDTRANFETDGGLTKNFDSADYNRTIGSCWINGKAFQKFPNAEFEDILNNVQTYIDAKESRERLVREQEEAERIATMTDEEIADQVRAERYRKIAATDYLAMPDYPLCDEDRAVVMVYRQALRDVPTQAGFPREVVWPDVPAVFKNTKNY